ncbi:MAG: DinB family protein [Flavitalea sp.]
MTSEVSDKKELLPAIHAAIEELLNLLSPLDNKAINTVPYQDSWTAGQLLRHVTKSIDGIDQALLTTGEPAGRAPDKRIEELKKIFLDFSHKMKSPDFIIPEDIFYEKQVVAEELHSAEKRLLEAAGNAPLTEMVNSLPLGPITKLELLHFTLFHTQRHLNQMKKIREALSHLTSS